MVAVTDLDPRDRFNRHALRTALRETRETAGISQAALAARLGIDQPGVGRYERGDQWRCATVLRWARALNTTALLRPTGFPAPSSTIYGGRNSDIDQAMHTILNTIAGTGDDWTVAKLQTELAGIRVACDIRQAQLCARIGVTEQALSLFERADNGTSVTMAQRHARGIALCAGLPLAYLSLALQHPGQEDPDAALPAA